MITVGRDGQIMGRKMNKNKSTYFVSTAKLKLEFLRLLTEDSPHHDARRRDFNQAIFDGEEGFAVFNGTDLEIVMEKFNKAVANLIRDHIADVLTANEANKDFYRNGYGSNIESLPGKP